MSKPKLKCSPSLGGLGGSLYTLADNIKSKRKLSDWFVSRKLTPNAYHRPLNGYMSLVVLDLYHGDVLL